MALILALFSHPHPHPWSPTITKQESPSAYFSWLSSSNRWCIPPYAGGLCPTGLLCVWPTCLHVPTAPVDMSKHKEEEMEGMQNTLFPWRLTKCFEPYGSEKQSLCKSQAKGKSQASRKFIWNEGNSIARPCLLVFWMFSIHLKSILSTGPRGSTRLHASPLENKYMNIVIGFHFVIFNMDRAPNSFN